MASFYKIYLQLENILKKNPELVPFYEKCLYGLQTMRHEPTKQELEDPIKLKINNLMTPFEGDYEYINALIGLIIHGD